MSATLFVFGFGYTALFLAQTLAPLGFQVYGTSRQADKIKVTCTSAYKLIGFTLDEIESYLAKATHVLISIPPIDESGDLVLSRFSASLIRCAPQIQWMGYLSSTGVYGDHQGAWVDEHALPHLPGTQGKRRLAAEHAWLALAQTHQLPLHIFRLSGIYGPGKNSLVRLMQGKKETIYKEGHFFSRIHVQDIASVLCASIQRPQPLSIYNVADNEPTPSHVVDEYAARLLGIATPRRIAISDATLTELARGFYNDNRRVANNKIKNELGVILAYPSYREGLLQLYLDLMSSPP